MTSRMTPLLEHNEQFARTFKPVPLGPPAAQVIVVTCLDHRVDPAITLGLELGDAPAPLLPAAMSVSGHVYDVDTGRVTTVIDARQVSAS